MRSEIYLSFNTLNLILKTGNHAVKLSNLSLGCAQVITVLSSRGLHLIVLLRKAHGLLGA